MKWLALYLILATVMLAPLMISCSTSSEVVSKPRDVALCVVATEKNVVVLAAVDKATLESLRLTPEEVCCFLQYILDEVGKAVAEAVADTIVGGSGTSVHSDVLPTTIGNLDTRDIRACVALLAEGVRLDEYSLDENGNIQKKIKSVVLKLALKAPAPSTRPAPCTQTSKK
jgi:hypothetical protein